MDSRTSFAYVLLGVLFVAQNSQTFFFQPVTDLVLNIYCGMTASTRGQQDPLRFSPWMVVITQISNKGKDIILKCDATLVSGKHALTCE